VVRSTASCPWGGGFTERRSAAPRRDERGRHNLRRSFFAPTKDFDVRRGGLALTFAATALLCPIGAAKAHDAPSAFHTYLGAAASIAALFAIFNRHFDRSAELPAQVIDGKPNYQLGPIKLATFMAMFWGVSAQTVNYRESLRISRVIAVRSGGMIIILSALVPISQPSVAGTRACRLATSADRPAAATPSPPPVLFRRPAPMGVPLPSGAAGPW